MDSFVVRTDYEDFAVMLQLSTEKLSGSRSSNLILYSERRKKEPSADVLGPGRRKRQHVCHPDVFGGPNWAGCFWMFLLQVERWR